MHRYKLSAKDIEPKEENKQVFGQFMFFGPHGQTLTGQAAILVIATTRGRADYIPPAISRTECNVVADVTKHALDAITFHVARCELVGTASPAMASTNSSKNLANASKPDLLNPTGIAPNPPGSNKKPESTTAKDIIETTESDLEDDTSFTTEGKKRKSRSSVAGSGKKSAVPLMTKRRRASSLFPSSVKDTIKPIQANYPG